MTDWKQKYDTLQKINESVVHQRNRLIGRVKYLETYVRELEDRLDIRPRRNGGMAHKRAHVAAEALFSGSGHEE